MGATSGQASMHAAPAMGGTSGRAEMHLGAPPMFAGPMMGTAMQQFMDEALADVDGWTG